MRNGDEYIINGSKCFITNGPLSDYFCVYALTDHELGPKSIATFVVERNTPGFSHRRPPQHHGHPQRHGPVRQYAPG